VHCSRLKGEGCCDVMLDDTATSSAVTSSRDTCDNDVVHPNDVIGDEVRAACHDSNMSEPLVVDATEYVDVSSTSSADHVVTSQAAASDVSVKKARSECRVCSDDAAGMYFGALVCVPCKVCAAHFDTLSFV